jgi:hypothetical protein
MLAFLNAHRIAELRGFPPSFLRKLRGQNIERMNLRRLCKQL